MHPVLFEIFGYQLRTYGFAMATAFAINILLVYRRAPVERQDQNVALNTCLWIVIGTLIGGRLLFALTQWSDFVSEPKKLISFWEGGLVFYGGFIGSYVAAIGYLTWMNLPPKQRNRFIYSLVGLTLALGYLFSLPKALGTEPVNGSFGQWFLFWKYGLHHCVGFLTAFPIVSGYSLFTMRGEEKDYRLLPILDLLSPYVGLGLAIHRGFGCFLNGCCYGRPTDSFLGVQFPLDHAGTKYYGINAHLHPSQLYESLNGLIIFFALLWFRKRKKAEGEVTAWLLIIYAINRYIIEFVRGDKLRGEVGVGTPLVTFVILFAAVTAGLFALLYWARRRGIAKGIAEPDDPKKVYGFFAVGMALMFCLTVFGELIRIDGTISAIGPLSTSQFIGYWTFVAGFAIFVISRYLGRRAEPLN
jgi:prolipoprotein diacylglyceryl transferase